MYVLDVPGGPSNTVCCLASSDCSNSSRKDAGSDVKSLSSAIDLAASSSTSSSDVASTASWPAVVVVAASGHSPDMLAAKKGHAQVKYSPTSSTNVSA